MNCCTCQRCWCLPPTCMFAHLCCVCAQQVIKRAVRNVYEMSLEDFIFGHPAQIALLGIQFQWTADTQAALVAAKTDKTIMTKNMKKTDAILKYVAILTVCGLSACVLCCFIAAACRSHRLKYPPQAPCVSSSG